MKWVIFAIVFILSTLLMIGLFTSDKSWQYSTEASLLYRGNAKTTNNSIALVVIDNKTFEKLENSPIQDGKLTASFGSGGASIYAQTVKNLIMAGASKVVIDVVFSSQQPNGLGAELALLMHDYPGKVVIGMSAGIAKFQENIDCQKEEVKPVATDGIIIEQSFGDIIRESCNATKDLNIAGNRIRPNSYYQNLPW